MLVLLSFLLLNLLALPTAEAFSHYASQPSSIARRASLHMVPRFDPTTQKWYPQTEDDSPNRGYPPIGSLFRQGPKSFFQRLVSAEEYEQSILKYMASEGCSRDEAQGNMDGK